jgi:septal ring factor EnvC (AmiA/AmiB activator)
MDDIPVPETLETIAAQITALSKSVEQRFATVDQRFKSVDQQFNSVDQRFNSVDQQFKSVDQQFKSVDQQFKSVDQQFADMKAHLGVKIEAVDAKVDLVLEAVMSLAKHAETNAKDHGRFTERLDNHDVRILALESSKPAKP